MTGVDSDLATLREKVEWLVHGLRPEDAYAITEMIDAYQTELSRLRAQRDEAVRSRNSHAQALTEIASLPGYRTAYKTIAREALAGPDTPADSPEDKT